MSINLTDAELDDTYWEGWKPLPLDSRLDRHRGWALACLLFGHEWERHPVWERHVRCLMCGKVRAMMNPGLRAAIRGNLMGSSYEDGRVRHKPEGVWPRRDFNEPPARRQVEP